jgi:D-glucosaminate-6-phosphate ammonia-lyase
MRTHSVASEGRTSLHGDPYAALGVRRVINAWGSKTMTGGSLIPPEVLDAMTAASKAFVDLNELNVNAGNAWRKC